MSAVDTYCLSEIAALNPQFSELWQRLEVLNSRLTRRADGIPVLVSEDFAVSSGRAVVNLDGACIYLADTAPSFGRFVRLLALSIFDLWHCRDGFTVPFVEHLLVAALTRKDQALLSFTEDVAEAVRQDGVRGLKRFGISIAVPMPINAA